LLRLLHTAAHADAQLKHHSVCGAL
jgi:hypothetical protein